MKRDAYIKYHLYDGIKEETKKVFYHDKVITYFDGDIKTTVDLDKWIITRENKEYKYIIDLSKYYITIHLNKEDIDLEIRINILLKKYDANGLYIKYLLVEENVTNEYEIKL